MAEEQTVTQEQNQPETQPVEELSFEQRADALIAGLGDEDEGKRKDAWEGIDDVLEGLKNDQLSADRETVTEASRRQSYLRDKLTEFEAGINQPAEEAKSEGEEGSKPSGEQAPSQKPTEKTPEQKEVEKKLFGVWHNGQRHEIPDEDGLLGYKNTGSLKAALLKQRLLQQDQDTQLVSLRQQFADAQRKIQEFEQRQKAETEQPPAQPAPQGSAAPPKQPEPEVQKVDRPTAPQYPTLSTDDPLDYTEGDKAALRQYQQDRAQYEQDFEKYIESQLTAQRDVPEIPVEKLPAEVQAKLRELDEMKQWYGEAKPVFESLKSQEQRAREEAADRAHWNRFEDFQKLHPDDFGTPRPIKETRDEVMKWGDTIASANGIQKPLTPWSTTDPQWQNYEAQRGDVIRRYRNGDQTVLQNAQGIDPPEGHEAYFKLAELAWVHQDMVQKKRLAPDASFEDAYWLHMKDTGHMSDALTMARQEAENAGKKAVVDQISESSNSAQNIDPGISAGPESETMYGLPAADINWFSSIGPEELNRLDAEKRKRYYGILERLKQFQQANGPIA